jgi:flagellar hook capping protein FlgD
MCAGALVCAQPAFGENPVEIGSTTGTCTGTEEVGYTVPTSEQPDSVVFRLTPSGGSGAWTPPGYHQDFDSGDALWNYDSPAYPIEGHVSCPSGQSPSFTVKAYRVPTTPSTFTGRGTPGVGFNSGVSYLRAIAPYSANYLADIVISSGAIQVAGAVVASSRTISLGGRSRNSAISPVVEPLDGPAASWTVTIRPQPVVLSGVDLSPEVLIDGASAQFSYTVDAEANVTAVLKNSAGQVIRSFASGLHVQPGDHSLTFDGLTQAGAPLPDGFYAVQLNVVDPGGHSAAAARTVAIDAHGPQVRMVSANPLAARNGFVASVSDQVSGVQGSELSIDDSLADEGTTRLSYRPSGGWTPGTAHSWKVEARDGSGNGSSRTGSFRVPEKSLSKTGAKRDIKAALKAARYRTWVRSRLRVRCARLSESKLRCRFSSRRGHTRVTGKGNVARKHGERAYNLKVSIHSRGRRPFSERLRG